VDIFSVANQKGGVGKTTSSVSLGGIAAKEGKRVLLIDFDPHGSLTSYFKLNPDTLDMSGFDLFQNKDSLNKALINELVHPTEFKNLHIIPASVALATLERQSIGGGMGLVLSRTLDIIKDQFDLVIIDCAPQLGVLLVNALAASQAVIVPVQTEFLAIQGLERMIHTMNMLNKSRGDALPYLVVPVMFDRRTKASVESLRKLRNDYADVIWPNKVPIDTQLRDASKAGVPSNMYAPNSRGVESYISLYNFLMKNNNHWSAA